MKPRACTPIPFSLHQKCCRVDGNGNVTCTVERIPLNDAPVKSWIVVAGIVIVTALMIPVSLTIPADVTRVFHADYIVLDAVLLVIFVFFLVLKKKWLPLGIAGAFAIVIFIIDGVIWWFLGIRVIDPPDLWVKILHDFMMTISYGIIAFSWLVMALQGDKDAFYFGALLFGGWLAVAFASQWLPLWDLVITTTRYMDYSRIIVMIVIIAGYVMLGLLQYDVSTILKTFLASCALGFFMEFSLWASGIRPSGFDFLLYDTFVLINQGAPFIIVIVDKLVPFGSKAIRDATSFARGIISRALEPQRAGG